MKALKLLATCACLTGWFSASALGGPALSPAPGSPAKGQIPPRKWSEVADGFASVNAMGQNGTTGGAGGETVTVTTRAELEKYAGKEEPYIIRVKGSVAMGGGSKDFPRDRVDVAADKTIIGVGGTAELVKGGLYVRNGAHNVIIRNLTIRNSPTDGVTIDEAHHVWVDHCHFYGHADGCLDSRKGTTYLTVSWCIFSDSFKPFGIGWDKEVRTQMTIHHNWFRNNQYRNPRAGQVLRAHLYNNYLQKIGVRGNWASDGTHMVLQNSFFENVNNPHDARSPGGPNDTPGVIAASGNMYRNTRGRKDTVDQAPFDPGEFYKYTLDEAKDIPEILTRYAGPQENIGQ